MGERQGGEFQLRVSANHTHTHTHTQAGRQACTQAQTDRQTDTHTHTDTEAHTFGGIGGRYGTTVSADVRSAGLDTLVLIYRTAVANMH